MGADPAAGVLVGALTTSTGTNGPPAVVLLQSRGLRPDQFRATLTSVFFAVDLVAVVVFTAAGDLDLEIAGVAALCAPALLVGALAGRGSRNLLSPEAFRVAVLVLLAGTGTCAVLTAVV